MDAEARTHLNRDMDLGSMIVIGIASVFIVIEIALGTQAWYYSVLQRQAFTKSTEVKNVQMVRARAEQMENIRSIDQEMIRQYVASLQQQGGRNGQPGEASR